MQSEGGRSGPQTSTVNIQSRASPSASSNLAVASPAAAFLDGRGYMSPQDVMMLAPDVMRHRAAVNYEAEAGNISSEDNIQKIPETLTVLRSGINLGKGESIINPESRFFAAR